MLVSITAASLKGNPVKILTPELPPQLLVENPISTMSLKEFGKTLIWVMTHKPGDLPQTNLLNIGRGVPMKARFYVLALSRFPLILFEGYYVTYRTQIRLFA